MRAFTVRISDDVYVAARVFAAATETTLGSLVEAALVEYLAEHDEEQLTVLMAEVREKFRSVVDRLNADE